MAEPATVETCPICLQHYGDEPTVVLTEKGANRVNISSNERGDNINVSIGTVVHAECRKSILTLSLSEMLLNRSKHQQEKIGANV